jgi:hypothetical protein
MSEAEILMLDGIVTLLTTLVGAFSGAWAAFKYQEHKEISQLTKDRRAAVNRALHTIYNLWNIQRQYQTEVIDLYRGKPDVWLNMQATPPPSFGLTTFQAEELSFFLESKHAQMYADLMLEEHRFQIAMNLINMRSSVALNEAWPRLGAAKIEVGESMDLNRMTKIIGIDVEQKLRKLTEGIIEHIDENEKSIREIHDRLREGFLDIYPDQKIIEIEFTGRAT